MVRGFKGMSMRMRLHIRPIIAALIAALAVPALHQAASAQAPQPKPAPKPAAPQPANDLKPAFDALKAGDYAKAERILLPMAERKDMRAQFMLGAEVYGFEKSPLYNPAKGVPLLRDAAERGFPRAQALYGAALAAGEGTAQDKVEAYKFLALASRQQVPGTESMLDGLAKDMSDDEIERAKKAANAFTPRK